MCSSEKKLKAVVMHPTLVAYVDPESRINLHQLMPVEEGEEPAVISPEHMALLSKKLSDDQALGVPLGLQVHHDPMSRFVERMSRSRILPMPVNDTLATLPAEAKGIGRFPVPMSSSFYMGELLATSVFSLSPSGTVFERFFNGVKWVYVRHELPGPRRLISVTTVASHGTIFVSDERGQLFQRISPGLDRPLAWKRVLLGHSVEAGGVTGSESRHGVRVFFVDSNHDIVAYSVHRRNWTSYAGNGDELIDCESNAGELWTVPGPPAAASSVPDGTEESDGNYDENDDDDDDNDNDNNDRDGDAPLTTAYPRIIIDAFTLLTGSIFAIDVHGQLIEHARSEHLWINHGHPAEGIPLSFSRAVVLRDSHPNRVGSIFLRRSDGTLVERWWDASIGGWRWMDHGHPAHTFVASAPGALHESRELYVVCGDGHLWSRAYIEDGWTWVDRGMPSSPLSLIAPIKVGGNEVMTVTLDGKMASIKADARQPLQSLGWSQFENPESFSRGNPPMTLYCSDSPTSPWNCIQGYKGGGEDTSVAALASERKSAKSRRDRKALGALDAGGTSSLQHLAVGDYGIRLREYSFFYTDSGVLDIGGDRDGDAGGPGGKRKKKKKRRKLPADWLKNNGDSISGNGGAGGSEGGPRAWLAKVFFDLWPLATVCTACTAVWYGNLLGLMPLPFSAKAWMAGGTFLRGNKDRTMHPRRVFGK